MSVIGSLKTSEEGNIFTWVFSSELPLMLHNNVVRSTEFGNAGQKFELEFHRGKIWDSSAVSCKRVWRLILRCPNQNSPLICKYNISIIKRGEVIDVRTDCCTFSTNRSETLVLSKTQTEIEGLISSKDDIHIRCELFYESAITNEVPKLNFDWVYLDEGLSDVKLKTSCGKEIPAHRVVLATASPVFKAMFKHDMMENQNKLVEMTDVSHEAAVEMLRYIYTGVVANNGMSLTTKLLAAAEYYQLEELKNKCEQKLSSILSIENAFSMLEISDAYRADYLKKNAVDFVKLYINKPLEFGEISNMILGKTKKSSKIIS